MKNISGFSVFRAGPGQGHTRIHAYTHTHPLYRMSYRRADVQTYRHTDVKTYIHTYIHTPLSQSIPHLPKVPFTFPKYPLLPQSTPYFPKVPRTFPKYPLLFQSSMHVFIQALNISICVYVTSFSILTCPRVAPVRFF